MPPLEPSNPSSPAPALEPIRHVLITGFPGFIAGKLLESLAPEGELFTLLVEARFAAQARAQADRIALMRGVAPERFEIVTGDITLPGLGLDAKVSERLRATVDTVFHLAAIYDLAVPAAVAEKVNVRGTENVNALLVGMQGLRRYNYISTYAVAGRRKGVVREHELEHDTGFNNHYESTKYEAEITVRRAMEEHGLPASIYRPGVVVGSSVDGSTAKFDGPYMLLKVMRKLPWPLTRFNVGSPDVRFQMVPVNFIVDALAALSRLPGAEGLTFHLTDPDPRTTVEIFNLFAEAMGRERSLLRVPSLLTAAVTASGLGEPLGLQRQAAPYFLHQARFDCMNTLDTLDGTGIAVPPLEEYVDRLVRYFLSHAD